MLSRVEGAADTAMEGQRLLGIGRGVPVRIPLAVMNLPILYLSGLWPNPLLYVLPMQGPLLLLGSAFDQVSLAPWQVGYTVLYPVACIAGLCWVAKALFGRYIVAKSGGF